jgi:hypothetical protein
VYVGMCLDMYFFSLHALTPHLPLFLRPRFLPRCISAVSLALPALCLSLSRLLPSIFTRPRAMERDELRRKLKMVHEEAERKRGAERQHMAWVWAASKKVPRP